MEMPSTEMPSRDMLDKIFPGWEPRCEPAPIRAGLKKCNELLIGNFMASGVPPKYHQAQVSDFETDLSQYSRKSVFIHGKRGNGKTHMAVALQKEWIWGQMSDRRQWGFMDSYFVSVSDLMIKLRSGFNNKGVEQEGEMIQRLCNAPLLILDDIGTMPGTDYAFQVLYVIINERYNWERATILTSNDSLSVLNDQFSEAIASRLYEMCDIIELDGKDYRNK